AIAPRTGPSSARSPPAPAHRQHDRRRIGPIVSTIAARTGPSSARSPARDRPIATMVTTDGIGVRVRTPPVMAAPCVSAAANGYKIRVLDAFYGRYSARICPKLSTAIESLDSRIARCSAKNSRNEARRLLPGQAAAAGLRRARNFRQAVQLKGAAYLRVRYTCVFRGLPSGCFTPGQTCAAHCPLRRLAKHSYGYWRRKHFRHRKLRLKRKLNKLRRRFRVSASSAVGCCDKIRKLLSRIKRAEKRIQSMLKKLKARKKTNENERAAGVTLKWHAGRWFLRRKLAYMRWRADEWSSAQT
uniref:C3H1-type domain-containing protein n=1 Tax=Macrostomum lignano TaxID=282301 RepID=A0A1I8FDU0_9PLAT